MKNKFITVSRQQIATSCMISACVAALLTSIVKDIYYIDKINHLSETSQGEILAAQSEPNYNQVENNEEVEIDFHNIFESSSTEDAYHPFAEFRFEDNKQPITWRDEFLADLSYERYLALTEEPEEIIIEEIVVEVKDKVSEDLSGTKTEITETLVRESVSVASNPYQIQPVHIDYNPTPVDWDGSVLTPAAGVNYGPSGKETYYNLPMDGVVSIMRSMGNTDEYWVREDGVKMLGDYVMIAANLDLHPRGSLVPTSLGIGCVCDTGGFALYNPTQVDIAVTW